MSKGRRHIRGAADDDRIVLGSSVLTRKRQATFSPLTFEVSIWVSGLYRCPSSVLSGVRPPALWLACAAERAALRQQQNPTESDASATSVASIPAAVATVASHCRGPCFPPCRYALASAPYGRGDKGAAALPPAPSPAPPCWPQSSVSRWRVVEVDAGLPRRRDRRERVRGLPASRIRTGFRLAAMRMRCSLATLLPCRRAARSSITTGALSSVA